MSVRNFLERNDLIKKGLFKGSLDIDDSLDGTCSARMIYGLGGADNDHYNSFASFKADLKLLYGECYGGAKVFFCFTNEDQDQEREYLKDLGFTTTLINEVDIYVSTISKDDLGHSLKPKLKSKFKRRVG